MHPCRKDMTLRDSLADPLIQAVMAADDVDATELAALLGSVAETLSRRDAQAARLAA